ncbi:TVP38/TMEM64 family protein [Granulicatella sp. zg-ZJ]|nr:TVP38/TMEM64 family protein [Carnobacteriaceae bacterium zg-ZUI78]NEW62116.1 TVP38/TMEM64 family protein [Granulicatella sp. zg-ZJ]NEW66848.1 TVP38/TMEM64 family protein [Granulicatella sp. zg-84]QMI86622.1 TVP38/TMEM64 family protein [Carnobacteriaceae bacterium zg-84]
MKQLEDEKKKEISEKYRKIVQIGATVGLVLTVLIAIWVATGTYFKPTDQGGMFETHLKQLGVFGPILFILIQIIQVVLPIIPGGAVSVSGTVVWGYEWGFVYNYIGIFIGSMIAFHLARQYGEFFVKCFVSDETYDKYMGWTRNEKRFSWILGILFFLPAAPDDILCMIAGLTTMSFKKFVWIFIPTKAVSTYVFTVMMQEMIFFFIHHIWPWLTNFFS